MTSNSYWKQLEDIKKNIKDCMESMRNADNNVEWDKYCQLHYDLMQQKRDLIKARKDNYLLSKKEVK